MIQPFIALSWDNNKHVPHSAAMKWGMRKWGSNEGCISWIYPKMVHVLCSKCQVYRSPCQHKLFTEYSLCKYLKVWSFQTNIDFLRFALHAKMFVINSMVPAQLLFNIHRSFHTSMLEISFYFIQVV